MARGLDVGLVVVGVAVVSAVIEDAVVVGGCGSSCIPGRQLVQGVLSLTQRAITPTAPTTYFNISMRMCTLK